MFFFSIITTVKNNDKYIYDCLNSLYSQTFKNYEHIIIDGGSTDKTIQIINKFIKDNKNHKIKFIKKKIGLYESLNLGIKLSNGKFIGVLHSDDFYKSKNILKTIFNKLNNLEFDIIYSNVLFCKRSNKKIIVRNFTPGEYYPEKFNNGWHFPHTSMIISKKLIIRCKMYNTNYKIASDYDLMLKLIKKQPKVKYLNFDSIVMRQGGISNKNFNNVIKANLECWASLKKNNYKLPELILIKKVVTKIFQLIKL